MLKHHKAVCLLLFLFITFHVLSGCESDRNQPGGTLEESLAAFSKALAEEDFDGMTLTIYHSGDAFTEGPYSKEDLIRLVEQNYPDQRITYDNNDLKKHTDVLCQINAINFSPAKIERNLMHADVYYIFETEDHEKVLEIVFWGFSDFEENAVNVYGYEIRATVFVNGFEVKFNEALYRLLEELPGAE